MTRAERERLEALTLSMLDGDLTAEESEELDALLVDGDAQKLHGLLLEQEAALRGERSDLDVVARTVSEIESGNRVEKRVLDTIAREPQPREPQRLAERWVRFAAAAALLLLVGFGGSAGWVASWSAAPQEALVFASKTLEPGSAAHLRVLVRHAQTLAPYADAAVRFVLVSADGVEAWSKEAATDAKGIATVDDAIPETLAEGGYTLRVVAKTIESSPEISRAVEVRRLYRIYVTTDKPRYQPGQTIHMRALAMTSSGLTPAGDRPLVFQVRDAKGNLVHERPLKTSAHGLASTDFELADQVNTGRYAVSAAIGTTVSERSVAVLRYVLPKLKVAVETDHAHYAPGGKIVGTVRADYVFGQPVLDATVAVTLKDAGSDVTMVAALVTAGEPGVWHFTAPVPVRFGVLAPGALAIDAEVVDGAGFTNTQRIERTVTKEPFLVDVVVAGGRAVLGVPNRFYLSFRTPDGRPTQATGTLGGEAFEADTSGIATVSLQPSDEATVTLLVEGMTREVPVNAVRGILLHSDRSIYEGGASMNLKVLASAREGTAFVDAVQGARTLWTQTVELDQGAAELAFDVPADVHGPVRLRVFRADDSGALERSDRVVMVRTRRALELTASLDRETYRPGETAKLRIAVTKDGRPAPAAVSIAGVDESVFAMSETRPGMEQAFFELDRALLDPGVSLFPLERVMSLRGAARERAAGAALSALKAPDDAVSLQGGDSYQARATEVAESRKRWLRMLGGFALLVPLVVCLLLLIAVMWKAGRAARATSHSEPKLAGAMRLLILAWVGGLVVPGVLALVGGSIGEEAGALFGTAIGAALFGEVIRRNAAKVRRHLRLDALVYAYITWWLGLLGLGLAIGDRLVPKDILAVPLLVTYVAWAVVIGFLAAAGRNLATGASGQHVVWLVTSRAAAGMLPLLVLPLFFFGVSKSEDAGAAVVAAPTIGPNQRAKGKELDGIEAGQGQGEPPRVRSYFPETLLWQPQLITDAQGRLDMDVPLADSITTWRLSMSAVSSVGELGAHEHPLRVFQPFFIEPNLPVALTQDDVVTVPVAVFNYLDTAQTVKVTLAAADWLQTEGATTQTVLLAPREVKNVAFVVKAVKAGDHRFRVEASADELSDAVERVVAVSPNGERFEQVQSGELKTKVELAVDIPSNAIAGSEDLALKLYPGAFSQVAEGMEGIFRMPYGCFEQTSSVTYPSLLVLDYMSTHKTLQPELQAKAERFISTGYQRLLSFEVPGGGFDWFGKGPSHLVLTAYGLMEFTDMARVQSVDQAMVQRTQRWLLEQQRSDGSWKMGSPGIAEGATNAYSGDDLRTTAYVAWSLAESGVSDSRLTRAFQLLDKAIATSSDSYTLALIANALVAGKQPAAERAIERLVALRQENAGTISWTSKAQGVTYGRGATLDIEVTALSAYALLRAKSDVAIAHRALGWLITQRDPNGTWRSTQATVAAMRALLAATNTSTILEPLDVDIVMDGETVKTIAITPETADVFHLVSLRAPVRKGARKVELRSSGTGTIAYQLVTTHYLPWAQPSVGQDLDLSLSYSAVDVAVGQELIGTVTLANRRADSALDMAMIDIAVIPGFTLDTESLDALVKNQQIERYDRRGSAVSLYVRSVPALGKLTLRYRQVAEHPAKAQAPSASAYLYYEPKVRDATRPVAMTVR